MHTFNYLSLSHTHTHTHTHMHTCTHKWTKQTPRFLFLYSSVHFVVKISTFIFIGETIGVVNKGRHVTLKYFSILIKVTVVIIICFLIHNSICLYLRVRNKYIHTYILLVLHF